MLARRFPSLFAEKVSQEVDFAVNSGAFKYKNLRYSGSGEVISAHLPALELISAQGVKLWGFTRDLRIAEGLRRIGATVIISCDKSSHPNLTKQSIELNFPLAYTSLGVNDHPPPGTVVTFPLHRIGRVHEVVETPSLCPKVLQDFLHDSRPGGTCQLVCNRCHQQ